MIYNSCDVSSRSYKSLKFEFVCSRISPILILILLSGFHKFQKSRGLNSSAALHHLEVNRTQRISPMLEEEVSSFWIEGEWRRAVS